MHNMFLRVQCEKDTLEFDKVWKTMWQTLLHGIAEHHWLNSCPVCSGNQCPSAPKNIIREDAGTFNPSSSALLCFALQDIGSGVSSHFLHRLAGVPS